MIFTHETKKQMSSDHDFTINEIAESFSRYLFVKSTPSVIDNVFNLKGTLALIFSNN
jgi:hypothetical protein